MCDGCVKPQKKMERGVLALAPFPASTANYQPLPATAFHEADSGVSPDAAVGAAVVAVCVAAAVRVSEPVAASAADDAVPSAASLRRWPAGVPVAGDPVPASVQVSGDPAVASHTAFPAVVGIFCPGSRLLC